MCEEGAGDQRRGGGRVPRDPGVQGGEGVCDGGQDSGEVHQHVEELLHSAGGEYRCAGQCHEIV